MDDNFGDFDFLNFDFDEEMNALEELPFGKFSENNKINKEFRGGKCHQNKSDNAQSGIKADGYPPRSPLAESPHKDTQKTLQRSPAKGHSGH